MSKLTYKGIEIIITDAEGITACSVVIDQYQQDNYSTYEVMATVACYKGHVYYTTVLQEDYGKFILCRTGLTYTSKAEIYNWVDDNPMVEEEPQPKADVQPEPLNAWSFVEEFYPNYTSSDEIAYSNDLSVIIDEEEQEGTEAYKILHTDLGGDREAAKNELAITDEAIYRKAILNFLATRAKSQETA